MKKQDVLSNKIISILESIPGIIGFSPIIDNDKDNGDFINLWINDDVIDISIGIIINRNITTKNMSTQIYETINFHLKKDKKYKLGKLNVYIKGVE